MKKRLIICADGTWDEPGQTDQDIPSPTNVCKLAVAVLPFDKEGISQITSYHVGVGKRGGIGDHFFGGAMGAGLSKNIIDLYLFLALNYSPGDELFLFGFSRGAYTIRSLAGLIRNSGILKNKYATYYKEAYLLYRDRNHDTHPKAPTAIEFRKKYSWPDFNIKFIGVWDTVGTLGLPFNGVKLKKLQFHDVDLSSHVDYAYQALAIDEKRKPFIPTLWKKQPTSPESQILEQVWFPGVHCNVGGGYQNTGLSDCALNWMWSKAESCGLVLDSSQKPRPDLQGTLRNSMLWYYRLLGVKIRILGSELPGSYERLSQDALTRHELINDYQPENMLNFLKSHPELIIHS
ncbi:MAG: DUF2235 domain-containing protein [Proteobacteria bacterium]|nr:DUF2235 domain-containing protein [Pseudomonadota bacterium]